MTRAPSPRPARSVRHLGPRPGPRYIVRISPVHGRGLFAARRIRPGVRIIEYTGERLDDAEVDARYDESAAEDPHTLLFRTGPRSVIDASVGGNAARFANHSCQPNCETRQEGDRIFIFAIRNIQPGVELTYDYSLEIEAGHSAARARAYACRCGAPRCRGSMLERRPAPRRRRGRARRGAK